MKVRIALIAMTAILTIVSACGDDDTTNPGGFSETTRSRYMAGCTTSQTEAFCECTISELEERFTEDEFLRWAVDATEEAPDDLIEISLACIAEADLGD